MVFTAGSVLESSLKGRKGVLLATSLPLNTHKLQRALALNVNCEFIFTMESRDRNILNILGNKRVKEKKENLQGGA